jgi:hypothetical protein
MLARSSIQVSRRPVAAPVYSTSSGRDRPLDRADHVGEADLRRRLRQPVAAVGAALARDDLGAAQLEQDVLEELERDRLCGREPLGLHRARRSDGELGERPQRVVHLGRDSHGWIL